MDCALQISAPLLLAYRGGQADYEIDLSLCGEPALSLADAADLRIYFKRSLLHADEDAFATYALGSGISILQAEETPEAPARIRLQLASAQTAAYPLGLHHWTAWLHATPSERIPLLSGLLAVEPL